MAITRIQAATSSSGFVGSVSISFAAPPTVGNAVIVGLISTASGSTTTDNRSNSYSLVVSKQDAGSGEYAEIYYCSSITTSGTPFTVTISGGSAIRRAVIIEVNPSLVTDQFTSANSSGVSASTGTTASLTGTEVFVIAIVKSGSLFHDVDATTPTWTVEYDVANQGEMDSRVVTSSSGTTQTATWGLNGANFWAGAITAFKAVASTAIARLSQLPLETLILSDAPISARLSQLPIEVLINTSVIPPTMTETTQFFVILS